MVRGAEVDGVRVLTRIAEEVTMEPVVEVDGRRTPILQEREKTCFIGMLEFGGSYSVTATDLAEGTVAFTMHGRAARHRVSHGGDKVFEFAPGIEAGRGLVVRGGEEEDGGVTTHEGVGDGDVGTVDEHLRRPHENGFFVDVTCTRVSFHKVEGESGRLRFDEGHAVEGGVGRDGGETRGVVEVSVGDGEREAGEEDVVEELGVGEPASAEDEGVDVTVQPLAEGDGEERGIVAFFFEHLMEPVFVGIVEGEPQRVRVVDGQLGVETAMASEAISENGDNALFFFGSEMVILVFDVLVPLRLMGDAVSEELLDEGFHRRRSLVSYGRGSRCLGGLKGGRGRRFVGRVVVIAGDVVRERRFPLSLEERGYDQSADGRYCREGRSKR